MMEAVVAERHSLLVALLSCTVTEPSWLLATGAAPQRPLALSHDQAFVDFRKNTGGKKPV
jgi:hypothetical protein